MPGPDTAIILVVDDDPADREIFRRILGREGHAVVEASFGDKALEILKNSRVDLMILDLNLRGMSALEVLEALRSMPTPKIIVATGSPLPRLLESAMRLGATTTLDKATAHELLAPMVRSLLQGQS